MTHQTVVLDVREDIRGGGAPCARIMDSAGQLDPGDTLQVIAPFEPTPLYAVLGREGFVHESREIGGGDWEVRFTKTGGTVAKAAPVAGQSDVEPAASTDRAGTATVELDLRGLEPPQPMVRILEALEVLPGGTALRVFTDRRPVHLYDLLEARGFAGQSEETPQGGCATTIRRR
jgi:uncharacterized protein (DUF2249 family)